MRLHWILVAVGLAVTGWCAPAIPARAEFDARVTADEPQYLLTAISLAEDRDLNIRDELRLQRWKAFHDAPLPRQTKPLGAGQRISPHDPLLPVLLAVPVAVAGWAGAKLALALMAGVLAAATVWIAVRRFGVAPGLAALVVVAFFAVPPLAVYGTQIYPEVPAALAVVAAVAAITGPMRRGGLVLATASLVALPWLSVKYLPVVVVLFGMATAGLLRRGRVAAAAAVAGVMALAAGAWLWFHRAVYGGWTAYAAGDHFSAGEATVMGSDPDFVGRSVRLLGLTADRSFGLAAWAPALLLAAAAFGALARRRPPGWSVLAAAVAVAWLTATFVALTMHGWWWPGRQLVVIVPLLVVAVAWFLHNAEPAHRRRWLIALGVLTALGVANWVWFLAEVLGGQRQLIIDVGSTSAPGYQLWRRMLPDGRVLGPLDHALLAVWGAVTFALAALGWRATAPRAGTEDTAPDSAPASSRAAIPTTELFEPV